MLCILPVRLMLLFGQQRARDLLFEHYIDLQGCQLWLKAQTVFLKGLCRVLNEAWKRQQKGAHAIDSIFNSEI